MKVYITYPASRHRFHIANPFGWIYGCLYMTIAAIAVVTGLLFYACHAIAEVRIPKIILDIRPQKVYLRAMKSIKKFFTLTGRVLLALLYFTAADIVPSVYEGDTYILTTRGRWYSPVFWIGVGLVALIDRDELDVHNFSEQITEEEYDIFRFNIWARYWSI